MSDTNSSETLEAQEARLGNTLQGLINQYSNALGAPEWCVGATQFYLKAVRQDPNTQDPQTVRLIYQQEGLGGRPSIGAILTDEFKPGIYENRAGVIDDILRDPNTEGVLSLTKIW